MYQGRDTEIVVKLYEGGYEASPLPAIGIEYTDLTMKFWIDGEETLSTHALTSSSWTELADGNYVLRIPGTLLDKTGYFWLQLSGVLIQDYEQQFLIQPTPPSFLLAPNKCVVSGNMVDLTGEPSEQEEISFRIASVPKSSGGAIINVKRIRTTPDAYGNFSVQLIRGSEVVVEIPKAGINNKFIVPDQATASLLSLLPPI